MKTEAVSSGSGSLTEPTKESLEPVVGVAFFPENLKRQFEDHLNLKAAKSPFPDSTAPIELDLGDITTHLKKVRSFQFRASHKCFTARS